jgi:Domain of unknown function (DUF5667)
MNASLFDRARAERFAQLLDEARGARRHHARSRLDRELTEPVGICRKLHAVRLDASPSADFKAELRAQLIATARREGIGATAAPELRKVRRSARKRNMSPRPRARGAIVVGVAAGTLALSGVSVASGEAMPGDTLYGMKRSTERAQLALAGSDVSRGQLYLDFARTRLHEAYQVQDDEASFIGSLRDMDNETLHGVRTLITSAMVQHDGTALDAIVKFIDGQRTPLATLLHASTSRAGRAKVTESLALLTGVEERSGLAVAALACGATISGDDALGPIPAVCGTTNRGQQPSTGGHRPAQPGTNAEGAQAGASHQAASPTPAPEKQEGGLLDELGRILGGLLG